MEANHRVPPTLASSAAVIASLDDGWKQQDIEFWDARRQFSDLARQALEGRFRERGLKEFVLSDRQSAWWAPVDAAPTNKIGFRLPCRQDRPKV